MLLPVSRAADGTTWLRMQAGAGSNTRPAILTPLPPKAEAAARGHTQQICSDRCRMNVGSRRQYFCGLLRSGPSADTPQDEGIVDDDGQSQTEVNLSSCAQVDMSLALAKCKA